MRSHLETKLKVCPKKKYALAGTVQKRVRQIKIRCPRPAQVHADHVICLQDERLLHIDEGKNYVLERQEACVLLHR